MGNGGEPARYGLRVRGTFSAGLLVPFRRLRARRVGPVTELEGCLRDQAALHGVLRQVEMLGLELIEVVRLDPGDSYVDRTP